MKKNLHILIGETETEITIRRLRKKEFRPLTVMLAERIDDAVKQFSGNVLEVLPDFFSNNMDFICRELILPFVSLSESELEEMDIADIFLLLKEMLEFNGIETEKLKNFFGAAKAAKPDMDETVKRAAQALGFGGCAVPS